MEKRRLKTSVVTLAAIVAMAATASAVPVTYGSRAAWEAAIGGSPLFTVDFEAFLVDTPFQVGAVDAGPFSLQQNGASTFRNLVEVPPFDFGDNNGTDHASMFTDFGLVTVTLTLDTALTGWGADFYDADTGELLMIALYRPDTTLIGMLDVPGDAFFGFTLDPGDTLGSIVFQSRGSAPEGGGEGFGMDNVSGAAVPEPSTLALLGGGLLALNARRRRARRS